MSSSVPLYVLRPMVFSNRKRDDSLLFFFVADFFLLFLPFFLSCSLRPAHTHRQCHLNGGPFICATITRFLLELSHSPPSLTPVRPVLSPRCTPPCHAMLTPTPSSSPTPCILDHAILHRLFFLFPPRNKEQYTTSLTIRYYTPKIP